MSDISSTPKAILRTPLLESPKRPPAVLTVDAEPKRMKLDDGMQEKSGECQMTDRDRPFHPQPLCLVQLSTKKVVLLTTMRICARGM